MRLCIFGRRAARKVTKIRAHRHTKWGLAHSTRTAAYITLMPFLSCKPSNAFLSIKQSNSFLLVYVLMCGRSIYDHWSGGTCEKAENSKSRPDLNWKKIKTFIKNIIVNYLIKQANNIYFIFTLETDYSRIIHLWLSSTKLKDWVSKMDEVCFCNVFLSCNNQENALQNTSKTDVYNLSGIIVYRVG